MSRAFVKEDSQEEPVQIPDRAPLPDGATNYVTPEGMKQLRQEKEELQNEKANLSLDDEDEQRRQKKLINGKLGKLQDRIDSAREIDLNDQPSDEVRFGATVRLEMRDISKTNTFQIVGVDQADFKKRKISFLSPIAQAVTSHSVGDLVKFEHGNETRKFKVLDISY